MLLAELLQDLRAGGRLVAEDLAADAAFERLDDLGWEAFRVHAEGVRRDHPRHLPVPGGGVLAGAAFGHLAEGALGTRMARAGEGGRQVAETEGGEVGDRDPARGQDVAQRVAALVAERGGVGGLPDAEAIADHHDGPPERPGHVPFGPFGPSSQRSAASKAWSASANQVAVS